MFSLYIYICRGNECEGTGSIMKSVFAGNIDSTERFFQVQWGVAQKLPVFSVVTDPGSALRVKTDELETTRPGSATENYSGRLCLWTIVLYLRVS